MTDQVDDIRMHEVKSSNVEAIGFAFDSATVKRLTLAAGYGAGSDVLKEQAAPEVGTMGIRFKGGRTYVYENVPAFVYVLIANDLSVGGAVQLFKKSPFMADYHQV